MNSQKEKWRMNLRLTPVGSFQLKILIKWPPIDFLLCQTHWLLQKASRNFLPEHFCDRFFSFRYYCIHQSFIFIYIYIFIKVFQLYISSSAAASAEPSQPDYEMKMEATDLLRVKGKEGNRKRVGWLALWQEEIVDWITRKFTPGCIKHVNFHPVIYIYVYIQNK